CTVTIREKGTAALEEHRNYTGKGLHVTAGHRNYTGKGPTMHVAATAHFFLEPIYQNLNSRVSSYEEFKYRTLSVVNKILLFLSNPYGI
ncbi:MAG: hypothetical protein QXO76_07890, partial [Thermoproteota archaeon]